MCHMPHTATTNLRLRHYHRPLPRDRADTAATMGVATQRAAACVAMLGIILGHATANAVPDPFGPVPWRPSAGPNGSDTLLAGTAGCALAPLVKRGNSLNVSEATGCKLLNQPCRQCEGDCDSDADCAGVRSKQMHCSCTRLHSASLGFTRQDFTGNCIEATIRCARFCCPGVLGHSIF